METVLGARDEIVHLKQFSLDTIYDAFNVCFKQNQQKKYIDYNKANSIIIVYSLP